MSHSLRTHWKLPVIAITCVAAGAGASAIATAGAATSTPTGSGVPSHPTARARHPGAARRMLARTVQGSLVVATPNGFRTVTIDRGTVKAVSGQQLTLAEGTKTATYKTVTLTIPTSARVRDNRILTTLANVTPGQRAAVIVAPQQTYVIAHTP